MLTGDESISSGVVLIDGISLIENIRKVSVFLITEFCPKEEVTRQVGGRHRRKAGKIQIYKMKDR